MGTSLVGKDILTEGRPQMVMRDQGKFLSHILMARHHVLLILKLMFSGTNNLLIGLCIRLCPIYQSRQIRGKNGQDLSRRKNAVSKESLELNLKPWEIKIGLEYWSLGGR